METRPTRSTGKVVAVAVFAFLLARSEALAQPPIASTELEGAWIVESMERDGRQVPPQAFARMLFVFAGKTLSHRGLVDPDRTDQTPFTIDVSTTPKRLDFRVPDGNGILAIYELNNSKVTLYFHRKGMQRPNAFREVSEAGTILLVLKKRT
jgi:uncharacterized protein (TIGR03067 family)